MTCSPTCCPPGACAASPASSNARCPTLGSRRALTATGPSRPSHPPKPSPSDEPDPRQTHNATALRLEGVVEVVVVAVGLAVGLVALGVGDVLVGLVGDEGLDGAGHRAVDS